MSRGRPHLARGVHRLPHRAAAYLEALRQQGAPAQVTDDPWTPHLLQERLQRGPHKSANDHVEFVREEMADFCAKGFWTVLPYSMVAQYPGLRLSPLGVIPQRGRRPRLIVDLSFWGVNEHTVSAAPSEAMQFGRALDRLLYRIRHANPRFGPVYLSKIDISDGFYRIQLRPEDALSLAVLLPSMAGEPPMVAIPLSLPMGWVESPPTFCAATETAADLANARYSLWPRQLCTKHRLDADADSPASPPDYSDLTCGPTGDRSLPRPPSVTTMPLRRPLTYTDVYVDDFISVVQGSKRRRRLARRILMHTIDQIFRPLSPSDGPAHKEPISVKKLRQGDASWTTVALVLGWVVDTLEHTIRLPPHRVQRLLAIFEDLRHVRRVSLKKWRQVLGELRSMVLAIPGGRGLFSVLQTGFRFSDRSRIRLDAHVKAQLEDFEALARDVIARPTRLAELIPDATSAIGSVDASGKGMGGVWFTPAGAPIVWREEFPAHIQERLVSWTNPHGDLTNSDFELAGVVGHQDVLAQHYDIRERTVSILNDNTPAIARSTKGSITSRDAAAYLLRISSLHQRHHRYLATFDHISGKANAMADDASRLWHLSDSAFLSYFNQQYPQTLPWRLCPLRPAMNSSLISALRRQRQDPQLFLNVPRHETLRGNFGSTFAQPLVSNRSSPMCKTPSSTSWSSLSATGTGASPKMVTPSDLAQWKTSFVVSGRRWPAWGPRTNAWSAHVKSTIALPNS